MEENVSTPMEILTFVELQEENKRLKEQIKAFEFKKDVESIYKYSWSAETCAMKYDESGILYVMDATNDLNAEELHKLFLKYGYDYVDNYFKKKHEEWLENHKQEESEDEENA